MLLDYKQIGRNLAKRRKELKLKQFEVCERAEINDKYLSCIETARSIPSLEVFLKLCTALETTPDHILLGTVRQTDYSKDDALCWRNSKRSLLTANVCALLLWTYFPTIFRICNPIILLYKS